MVRLIVGTFVVAVMCCGAASADDGDVVGLGAGTVGMETPGLPVGTATATATASPTATASMTPTSTTVPTEFVELLGGESCAVVEPREGFAAWWLAVIPPAIAWRRHRRQLRSRADE